jgi:hypothetical protein
MVQVTNLKIQISKFWAAPSFLFVYNLNESPVITLATGLSKRETADKHGRARHFRAFILQCVTTKFRERSSHSPPGNCSANEWRVESDGALSYLQLRERGDQQPADNHVPSAAAPAKQWKLKAHKEHFHSFRKRGSRAATQCRN